VSTRAASRLRRLKRVLLGVLVVTVGIIGLEGLASLGLLFDNINVSRTPGNFRQAQYDSLVGWVGLPNMSSFNNYGPNLTLSTNSQGMRIHRPVPSVVLAGERRAVCSGDSFAFGSGVSDNETFCAYLEHEISNLVTLNMSQRGFGIDQMYLWYKRDAVLYPHSLHLLAFIWADFERMATTSFSGYPKPRLRLKGESLVVENVPVPQWTAPSQWSQVGEQIGNLRLVQLIRRNTDMSDSAKLQRVDDQVWDVAEAVFKDVEKLNRERGSSLVMVYLPAPPDLVPGAYDNRRNRLAAFSQRTGIRFVDLTAEIRAVPADSLDWMFITANALPVNGSAGHYTAMGHEWVAKKLAAHLRALGVVDSSGAPKQ